MTLGLLITSFTLGLRHGVDWDHIAAIADLNSAAEDRRRGFWLSLLYALGHAAVVFALGTVLIVAGASIPESLDEWMGRIVGATLVALGVAVLWDLRRNKGAVRLRSRWMLVLDGTFAGLRRVRQSRNRRKITVEHEHEHEHEHPDSNDPGQNLEHESRPAHDHAHDSANAEVLEHATARELQPSGPSGATGSRRARRLRHRHRHSHELDLPTDQPTAGAGVAAGVGMLHGVGIESPTQIAIFVASTSVVGTGAGLVLLGAWVIGLVIANAGLAIVAGAGLLGSASARSIRIVRALAVTVAALSIALGVSYLLA